ncbi:hypothetical protein DENSPDRAFT_707332 [Dentipellis sp. KUC8613]|nr:hypothetical protein DENSPDRAFT_707332 [Dentipellis sp. KUC8613]
MPRAAKTARNHTPNLDREFDSLFATQSSEHEDLIAQVNAAVEQKQAAWEKKKKTRDVNFVGVLRKEVGKATSQRAAAIQEEEAEAFELLDHLLVEYAENEDAIRKLWSEVLKEVDACCAYFHQAHAATRTADAEREAASIRQLAIAKHACEDSEDIVKALGNGWTST